MPSLRSAVALADRSSSSGARPPGRPWLAVACVCVLALGCASSLGGPEPPAAGASHTGTAGAPADALRRALVLWAEGRTTEALARLDAASAGGEIARLDALAMRRVLEQLPPAALVPAAAMLESWLRRLLEDERDRPASMVIKALETTLERLVADETTSEDEARLEARRIASRLWTSIAVSARARGQLRRAGWALGRAVELDPANAVAWHALGALAEKRGAYREAASAFDRVLEIEPEHAEARLRRALAGVRLGDSGALRALARIARGDAPDWVRVVAIEERARGLAARGELELALDELRAARRLFPGEQQLAIELLWLLDDRSPEARGLLAELERSAGGELSARTRYNFWPQDYRGLRRRLADDDRSRRAALRDALRGGR